MSHAAAVLSEYKSIPISLLDESTTNPRRTFEPSKLVELAHSISISGLIQPITVRPKADRFEIIAGARRYRAAQIAELTDVPTRVLDLDDAQTLEIQIVENSQREDVHPYEEASGYQRLLDLPGYDVTALASKCSKSPSHIYSRLTLLSLIPEVADAFQKDELTASHANLLARLSAEQQAQAFPNAFRKDYQDDERHLLPAKHLAAWIQDNLYLALGEAPFDTESASLLPEAGSCPACPKRTGFNTALFADVTDDNCLDGDCFRSKIDAHIQVARNGIANLVQISTMWRPAQDRPTGELSPMEYRFISKDGQDMPLSQTCESLTPAIVTYGNNVGTVHTVCADHDCPTHYPRHAAPLAAGRTNDEWETEMAQRAEERQQREQEKAKREERLRTLILRFPSSGTAEQTRFLLTALVRGDVDLAADRIAQRLEGETTDDTKTSQDVCADALATCMPSSLFGYLAELALGSLTGIPGPDDRDYLIEAEQLFPKVAKIEPAPAKKAIAKPTAKKVPAKKAVATKAPTKTAAAKKVVAAKPKR
jgi:ParB family chromosome partitioning protein